MLAAAEAAQVMDFVRDLPQGLDTLIGEGGYKVPAERLSDLLWPDSDGDQAAQNLKVALHRLRRLGCAPDEAPVNWIHVKHGHVSLARSLCWVDAHAGCN